MRNRPSGVLSKHDNGQPTRV